MFMYILLFHPWNHVFKLRIGPWPELQSRGGGFRPDSGEEAHQQRRPGLGKGGGGRGAPIAVLGSREYGLRRVVHGGRRWTEPRRRRVVGDGVGRPVLGAPLGRGAASGGRVWSMWGWGGGTTARWPRRRQWRGGLVDAREGLSWPFIGARGRGGEARVP